MALRDEALQVRASLATGAFARGGWVRIANGQLEYYNNKADRLLTGRAHFVAPFDCIRCVGIVRPQFSIYNLFNGGLIRTRLKLVTIEGDSRLFVLRDPWSLAQRLQLTAGVPECHDEGSASGIERATSAVAFLLVACSLISLTIGSGSQSWLPTIVGVCLLLPVLAFITLTRPKG